MLVNVPAGPAVSKTDVEETQKKGRSFIARQ
jgi:hypothetical protein